MIMNHDIYKTREKIGIDKIGPDQRKKLFEEFVKHGGQVIDESKRPRGVIVRKKAYSSTQKTTSKEESISTAGVEIKDKTNKTSLGYKIQKENSQKHKPSDKFSSTFRTKKKYKLSHRIILYYKALTNGIIGLNGISLNKKFINFIKNDCTNCLFDLNIAITSFLKDETSIKQEIIRLSKGSNSTFYEFIIRLYYLYNEKEFDIIKKIISNGKIPSIKYLYLFKQFFKRFYILAQHTSIAKLYLDYALETYKKKNQTDADVIEKMRSHLKSCINILFYEFYPKFHILFCLMAKKYYPLYTQPLDDFLEMTDKDKIGYITKIEKKKRIEMLKKRKELMDKRLKEDSNEASKKNEIIEPPRHVQRGMKLIDELFFDFEAKLMYDHENNFNILDKNDKMYKTALLTEIFENEYSFILTTSKIQFNIDYQEQKKIDIKSDLSNAYIDFSRSREEINEYFNIVREIKKTEEDSVLTIYQKEIMLDKLEMKRTHISRTARAMISEVMKEIEKILSIVIEDYRKSRRLLQNPDETLQFDPTIDGEKRLNYKKVIEAIVEAFLFSATFSFMLKFGELSGSNLYINSNNK